MTRKLSFVLLSLLLVLQVGFAQQIRVSGVVISEEDGEPIIGASVIVKGTTIGTVTDIDGNFSLDAPSGSTIVVSYVGMQSRELNAQQNMRITLSTDALALDEVMVVAYGTAKKSSFTGSAAAVGSQTFERRALTNIGSALEGNVAGLQVTSGSGQPGEAPEFRIRGFGSINSSSDPLLVLDGAIFRGNLADINPSDIESMTVLKDAASTALYGSSASNGVILITTKQAKEGAPSVNLNISQGFSRKGFPEYDRVNVWDYYPLQWEMLRNTYHYKNNQDWDLAAQNASKNIYDQLKYNPFRGIANDAIVGTDGKLNPAANSLLWGDDLDWEDEAYGTGHRQDYSLSYSTKTEKSDMYASIGYLNDKGYEINTDFERFTGRVNVNLNPVKWFKTGLNIGASRTKSNRTTSEYDSNSSYNNVIRFVRVMAPIYPVYKHDPETGEYLLDSGGNKIYDTDGNRVSETGRHAIAEALFNNRLNERDQLTASTYLQFNLLDGLNFTVKADLENRNDRLKTYENTLVGDGAPAGRLSIRQRRTTNYQFNQILSYTKSFGDHSLDLLAGHENMSYTFQHVRGMRQLEIVSGLEEFDNFVTINSLTSYTDEYKKEGYLFRANYNYADRYYGSLSYRRDGSSRFHKDNRWGNFWSFGASWRIDQEEFMDRFDWVNSLKLRASYGETGNDALFNSDATANYYAHQTLYNNGLNNRDEPGIFFDLFGNPDLKWETGISTDVGIEFGLFDRLTGTVEYFQRDSRDLLFRVPTPTSTGVRNIQRNIGKISNRGVEIDLNFLAYQNKDWRINIGGNITFLKNEIKDLPEDDIVDGVFQYRVGKSRYDFWLRQFAGVNPENGKAYYAFDPEQNMGKEEFEKDGKKYTYDISRAMYDYDGSSAVPKATGGFNFSVRYKDFELGSVFTYQFGGKVLDESYQALMNNRYGYAMHTDMFKAWKQEGDITDVPRLDQSQASNFDGATTRWLVSSNYLSIKNITLSYNLPKSILRPIGMKSTRLTAGMENVYTFTARKGLNPTQSFRGRAINVYMPARVVTFGLNVSF